ncbi:Uncharacterised protein [uncultured archaeon]|nr:Uncharacterised protein [uncultured archaeon]
MVDSRIQNSLYNLADQFIAFIPTLVAVIVLIILGWILGTFIGKIGAKILDKIGLDNLIDKTSLGGIIRKAGMNTVGFFESTIKLFIYIIFAAIILDILKIQIITDFVTQVISYIPLIVTALIVLIIGLIIVDFLADIIRKTLVAMGVDDKIMKSSMGEPLKASGASVSGILSGLIKLFGYLIFILAAVEILRFKFLTEFLINVLNYIPNLFTGVLILIIGFLSIDIIMDYMQATMKGMNVEGSEMFVPLMRGFLFLVLIVLAFDTMLIKTNIFYIFLGPIAWGVAIVVAFKYGVKDALVAYAKEKK